MSAYRTTNYPLNQQVIERNGYLYMKNQKTDSNVLLTITVLIIILFFSIFLNIMIGSVKLNPVDIINCLFGDDKSSVTYTLITTVRIPRMVGGLFAGMGLACSGVILQNVMNNSLASPNTIGINSGAGFAVMLSMILLPGNLAAMPAFAFTGAFITSLLIFLLAYFADSSRTTIILAGITVSTFLNSGINTLKLLDTDITINITSFMVGSLTGLTMKGLFLPAICISIAVIISIILSRLLNILNLGDDIARSLGVNVSVIRFILLMLSSIMAGCVVSYAGLISFVGLIVPHICRHLFGNDSRLLLPCSALLGPIAVLSCDLIGKVILSPYELPVGIILSFIGGPFFLYLLMKKKGGRRLNA